MVNVIDIEGKLEEEFTIITILTIITLLTIKTIMKAHFLIVRLSNPELFQIIIFIPVSLQPIIKVIKY